MYKTTRINKRARAAAWLVLLAMVIALLSLNLQPTMAAGDLVYDPDLIKSVTIGGNPRVVTKLEESDEWISTNLEKIQAAATDYATVFCVWKIDGADVINNGIPITVTAVVGDSVTDVKKVMVLVFFGNQNNTNTPWDEEEYRYASGKTIGRGNKFNQPRSGNIGYYVYIYEGPAPTPTEEPEEPTDSPTEEPYVPTPTPTVICSLPTPPPKSI